MYYTINYLVATIINSVPTVNYFVTTMNYSVTTINHSATSVIRIISRPLWTELFLDFYELFCNWYEQMCNLYSLKGLGNEVWTLMYVLQVNGVYLRGKLVNLAFIAHFLWCILITKWARNIAWKEINKQDINFFMFYVLCSRDECYVIYPYSISVFKKYIYIHAQWTFNKHKKTQCEIPDFWTVA